MVDITAYRHRVTLGALRSDKTRHNLLAQEPHGTQLTVEVAAPAAYPQLRGASLRNFLCQLQHRGSKVCRGFSPLLSGT
jgi:hypothetical protein